MRTKQEVIGFLESKVGTKVVCVGNSSLDGQCVSLIKSLMDFLGVPEPYKARGHAKDCIAKYLSEGIAKPGLGFISVFSNKDMGGGYGHIWCNAGDGDGVFYESNGVKPLIVTKGKTYTYDAVCNFDSYIVNDVPTSDLQKQLDEANLHKSNLQNQVNGLLKDIDALKGELSAEKTKNGTLNGRIQELTTKNYDMGVELGAVRGELSSAIQKIDNQNKVISSYVNEDAIQIETLKRLEREANEFRDEYYTLITTIQRLLKLTETIDSSVETQNVAVNALQKLVQSTDILNEKIKTLETEIKRLNTHKKPIDKLTTKEVFLILVNKLIKRS